MRPEWFGRRRAPRRDRNPDGLAMLGFPRSIFWKLAATPDAVCAAAETSTCPRENPQVRKGVGREEFPQAAVVAFATH